MLLSTLSQLKEPLPLPTPCLAACSPSQPAYLVPRKRILEVSCRLFFGCHPRQDLIPVAWLMMLGYITLYLFPDASRPRWVREKRY